MIVFACAKYISVSNMPSHFTATLASTTTPITSGDPRESFPQLLENSLRHEQPKRCNNLTQARIPCAASVPPPELVVQTTPGSSPRTISLSIYLSRSSRIMSNDDGIPSYPGPFVNFRFISF